jgi:predicted nucleotidyltransferase
MTWLLPEQLTALTELQAACGRQGAEAVIIGAAAYRTWFNDPGRYTEDVDVAVAIDLEEFAQLAEALAGLGWRQEARREHRWHTPAGARVDLLPAGRKLRAAGRIEWPRSGMVMNLVGFEHVFAQAVTAEVAPGTALRVIPVPVLALLKIASFLDSPDARKKDAQDILSILERYETKGTAVSVRRSTMPESTTSAPAPFCWDRILLRCVKGTRRHW